MSSLSCSDLFESLKFISISTTKKTKRETTNPHRVHKTNNHLWIDDDDSDNNYAISFGFIDIIEFCLTRGV